MISKVTRIARSFSPLAILLLSSAANAQGGAGSISNSLVRGLCSVLNLFAGPNATILTIVVLLLTAVFVVTWYLSENKEGPMMYFIKTAIVVGFLINIFTVPQMLGLPVVQCT